MGRGHDRERDVQDLLERHKWACVRAAGSLGTIDLVAIGGEQALFPYGLAQALWPKLDADRVRVMPRPLPLVLLVEVKSTRDGPYKTFGPKARACLADVARKAHAQPLLAWWPPVKPGGRKLDALQWIPERDWP